MTVSKEELREMIQSGAFGDKQTPNINIKEVLETGHVTIEYGSDVSPVSVDSILRTGASTVRFNMDRLPVIEEILSRKKK